MEKYPKPILFKPTAEQQAAVAKKVAKDLCPDKAVRLEDGSFVQRLNDHVNMCLITVF